MSESKISTNTKKKKKKIKIRKKKRTPPKKLHTTKKKLKKRNQNKKQNINLIKSFLKKLEEKTESITSPISISKTYKLIKNFGS